MAKSSPSLRRLRELRVPREREAGLGAQVEQIRTELTRRQRGGGKAAAAWEVVVPDALREVSDVVGLSRGVLTIRARHAAARFEVDRFLRSGGEAALSRAAGVAIRRVKIV